MSTMYKCANRSPCFLIALKIFVNSTAWASFSLSSGNFILRRLCNSETSSVAGQCGSNNNENRFRSSTSSYHIGD